MHLRKIKVKDHSVQKLERKLTETSGRTEPGCITLLANAAVSNKLTFVTPSVHNDDGVGELWRSMILVTNIIEKVPNDLQCGQLVPIVY